MSFPKSAVIFAGLMALGLFGYRAAWSGFYPLALVNYRPIYVNEVDQNLNLAYTYYQNALLYSGSDPSKLDLPESYDELKRAVIDEAISRNIIYRELGRIMGAGEIREISERNIENSLSGRPDTAEGVEKLYGLSLEDFREKVLLPQAHREILEGRMNLNNQDFNSWLEKSRKESRVIILSPFFSWDGEKVILK